MNEKLMEMVRDAIENAAIICEDRKLPKSAIFDNAVSVFAYMIDSRDGDESLVSNEVRELIKDQLS